jgi:DNA-binding response OmpR family regulator
MKIMTAPSILVVEDEKDVREVIAEMMSYFGYDALIVSSGEEALVAVKDRSFNLIITDLGLPGIDGREMVKKIRLNGIKTPVLVATGVELENDKIELNSIISCDFIQKPFKIDDLHNKIASMLKKKNNKLRDINSHAP